MTNGMRVAAFGFRSLHPRLALLVPTNFALELFPQPVSYGHMVLAYNRPYPGQMTNAHSFHGVTLKYISTVLVMGFDILLHLLRALWDTIFRNTADIVHIQNIGNRIFALVLLLFGKKVYVSQNTSEIYNPYDQQSFEYLRRSLK